MNRFIELLRKEARNTRRRANRIQKKYNGKLDSNSVEIDFLIGLVQADAYLALAKKLGGK